MTPVLFLPRRAKKFDSALEEINRFNLLALVVCMAKLSSEWCSWDCNAMLKQSNKLCDDEWHVACEKNRITIIMILKRFGDSMTKINWYWKVHQVVLTFKHLRLTEQKFREVILNEANRHRYIDVKSLSYHYTLSFFTQILRERMYDA